MPAVDLPLFTSADGLADPPPAPARRPARDAPSRPSTPLAAVGASMRNLVELASRVAAVESTVLITGESGVGKERLARLIHDESPRRGGPFAAVNCGALPDTLFESELFGHARGAFTGAIQERPGIFELAHHGTLLLDEIGETPLPMQVKLLRVLQERQVRRLGDVRERTIDVRIVAATNRPLVDDVASGRFRADLFYRLKVVELAIPPLRKRPEDVRRLTDTILRRVAQQMRRPIHGYTPEALDRLLAYDWPGNVRELENAIERACAVATDDLITVADLPDELRRHGTLNVSHETVRPLHTVERDYILAVLRLNRGNKTRTAAQLGIGSATLFRKLKRYAQHG